MKRETMFSSDRKYRYTLWREFDMFNRHRYAMFIGLNPSKADEVINDNTVTRCINFAKSWGMGALCMTNLFAFMATEPKEMKACPHPVGEENNKWLTLCAQEADIIIAAWGNDGKFLGRNEEVMKFLDNLQCLGITKLGQPIHPLYVPGDRKPMPYKVGINERKDKHQVS